MSVVPVNDPVLVRVATPITPLISLCFDRLEHCVHCDQEIKKGQFWIDGCPIPNQFTKACHCRYADQRLHMDCCIEHIQEQECDPIESWYIVDYTRKVRNRSFYWKQPAKTEKEPKQQQPQQLNANQEDHALISCPMGCGEYKHKIAYNEYISIPDWLERHFMVCPNIDVYCRGKENQ